MVVNQNSNSHQHHKGNNRVRPVPLDLMSISSTTAPPIIPGTQSTNLVQLGQYIKEGEGYEGMPAKNARSGGYDHRAWFAKYKKMRCPADWYLSYEVLDFSKYTRVDCITKSVLLFQHLFRRPPLTEEEVMRCYDGSPILFESVRPFEERLDNLFESTFREIPILAGPPSTGKCSTFFTIEFLRKIVPKKHSKNHSTSH